MSFKSFNILSALSALSPLILFLIIFLGSGLYFSFRGEPYAFYQISASVAILPAIILAIVISQEPIQKSIEIFLEGVRDNNIIIMCLIYLLAGALATVLQDIGSVKSTVHYALHFIPAKMALPALFVISALVSTAMGTSMGTIAAVGPIGAAIAGSIDLSLPIAMGTIVGGSMFGDNLSVISDTSIAATQIHGCSAIEKFKSNFVIALPAMIITLLILLIMNHNAKNTTIPVEDYQLLLSLPYLAILGLALSGFNVFIVLTFGILISGTIGLLTTPSYSFLTLSKSIFEGYKSMTEILILSLLMGGLSALIKSKGGFTLITQIFERMIHTKDQVDTRSAEGAICAIVSFTDICTANNTMAIILSGEVTREITTRHHIPAQRAATLVDLFSCIFQGILPYSAQILLAGSLAHISPLIIVPHVYYCFLLGGMGSIAILFQWPSFSSQKKEVLNLTT